MPDVEFAAYCERLEQERRERRQTGDGMAVVAPRFMHWSGERVAPPKPAEPWYDASFPSTFHRHDDACLVALDEVVEDARTPAHRVGPGWSQCNVTGQIAHDHAGVRVAHLVGDRCPDSKRG